MKTIIPFCLKHIYVFILFLPFALLGQTVETFYPQQDAYIEGSRSLNNSQLRVEGTYRTSFLKFDLGTINGTVTSAKLRLRVKDDSGTGLIHVNKGNGGNWTETTLNTTNRPANGVLLGSIHTTYSVGAVHEITLDHTNLGTGIVSIVLNHFTTNPPGNDTNFYSRESSVATNRPQIIITYNPTSVDTQAPTAPSLSASGTTTTTTNLNWTQASDNVGVTGYKLFQGTTEIYNGPNTNKAVTGLSPSTSYNFSVVAYDAAGNTSVSSNVQSVQTNTPADGTAPSAPTNLQASVNGNSVNLTWNPSSDNVGVAGYHVYQDNVKQTTQLITGTQHQVSGLSNGTYSFTVKAQDAAGNLSTDSNTANATIASTTTGGSYWVQPSGSTEIYFTNGNVGIGTTNIGSWELAVGGKIRAEEIKVETDWADYVFFADYQLPTLQEVEQHIKEKGHLINIPSASEVQANGIQLGEMNRLLLEKIEELTLYMLQHERRIKDLENKPRH